MPVDSFAVDVMQHELTLFVEEVDAEPWKISHNEAMGCRRVEDLLRRGLVYYRLIRGYEERIEESVREGLTLPSTAALKPLAALYESFLAPCMHVLQAVAECEAKGYSVEMADEFRAAVQDAATKDLDTDAVLQSIRELDAGHGIPHAEAMRELRGRLGA